MLLLSCALFELVASFIWLYYVLFLSLLLLLYFMFLIHLYIADRTPAIGILKIEINVYLIKKISKQSMPKADFDPMLRLSYK